MALTFPFRFINTALNCTNFLVYDFKRSFNLYSVRKQRNARAVNYLYNTLCNSFDVERCTEGSHCSLAISDNNGLYLPISITSSLMIKTQSGRSRYRFCMSHKKNCVAILVGTQVDSEDVNESNTLLWYVDAIKMKQLEKNTTLHITLGCNSEKKMPRVFDLEEFILNQLMNKSFLDAYDNVMRKNGEAHRISLKNCRMGETFAKFVFEKAGFKVESSQFPTCGNLKKLPSSGDINTYTNI